MRPNYCFTCFRMSILVALVCTLAAESEDDDCVPDLKVRRHTVYNASLGENLRIKCPVTFCNSSQLPISWYKFGNNSVPVDFSRSTHIKTKWEISSPVEGISYLIFQNIQKSDSGQYLCETGGSRSHFINVYVYDNGKRPNDTQNNATVTSESDHTPLGDQWMYVYSAAGIVGFVVIVTIISVISMRGCKGTPKKETHTENQHIVIPMDEQPASHGRRGGPSVPPSTSEPDELPREHVYGMMKDYQRNMAEDETSIVVYAVLNHQLQMDKRVQSTEKAELTTVAWMTLVTVHITGVHCARKSKNTRDLSPQPLPGRSPAHQHALPTFHICEDDLQ